MVDIAFGELRLHRVEAGTIPSNVRSQAVLRAQRIRRFGVAPAYLKIAGEWQDHVLFQRLNSAEDGAWHRRGLDPAHLRGAQHRLRAIGDLELGVDAVQVRAHRAGGDAEVLGDVLVDLAGGQLAQRGGLAA